MRERADLYVPWELRGELLAVSVVCLVLRVSFNGYLRIRLQILLLRAA